MATSNVQVMAKRVKGGSFLTEERDPQDVFTPEDLSEEHRQIARTAIDFTQNEVMPAAAAIEAKNFEVTRGLLRKAGELGLDSKTGRLLPPKFCAPSIPPGKSGSPLT